MGMDSCGLAELIAHVFSRFSPEQRKLMGANVVVSGGSCKMQGVLKRLEYELRCALPFQSDVVLRYSGDPSQDAWRAASRLAAGGDNALWITKKEYEEMGQSYLKEHRCSNKYLETPEADPPQAR
jgi:actin-related protein